MVAYKIWHDQRHYIHKDTTNDMNVSWTTDSNDAKVIDDNKGYDFFMSLGFQVWNQSLPNSLKTSK